MAIRSAIVRGSLVAIGSVGMACGAASAQVIAFSHDDFSESQGYRGWYYGYFDGNSDTPWGLNDFEPLPIFDGYRWRREDGPTGFWTSLDRDGGHPNGTITSGGRQRELNWAVRRWVSDGNYILHLTGRLWDADPTPTQGNGVIGYIMVDGDKVWQATVENGNEHGATYDVEVCTVTGTIIDFAIAPRDGDDLNDSTGFHSRISTVIMSQPTDTMTCSGGTADFFVLTTPGDFTYQWRFNGMPIEHDGNMPRLRVVNVTPDKVGAYDCLITNGCGSMLSREATLTICDADFDCDGVIDSQDFFSFVNDFFVAAPRSDINHDGFFNTQDYFDFLTMFFNGCPA
ncbi:MAG: GC-type dockerin domain-anchored protein [Phycisphaerales bacterium]